LQEAHEGGLMGHFGLKKMEDVLAAHFFWPRMQQDVERSWQAALLVKKLSLALIHMVYICLFMFLVFLGRIF
jgi:hypothetical protein